jgi:TATA-binding protein-associated factor Taf7
MIITSDKALRDFDFWSGAVQTANNLTTKELDQIEDTLMELYPEGMSDVELNDLFWFESTWVYEQVGRDELGEPIEDEDEDEDEDSESDLEPDKEDKSYYPKAFECVRQNALANPNLYGGRYTQKSKKEAYKEFIGEE